MINPHLTLTVMPREKKKWIRAYQKAKHVTTVLIECVALLWAVHGYHGKAVTFIPQGLGYTTSQSSWKQIIISGALTAYLNLLRKKNMKSLPFDYEPPATKKPRKYPISPELHGEIKKLYQNKIDSKGMVAAFAKKHGMPRWKVTRYAVEHGWTSKQKKEPDWTKEELSILKNNAMHCPGVIQRKLKRSGFKRSVVGIVLKRKRMRYIANLPGQSAQSLAMCLGEDVHFVLKAIDKGLIKAVRRQQERTPVQGGNAYLIRDRDAKSFVIENIHMIDTRKVDKYWLIDLLTS